MNLLKDLYERIVKNPVTTMIGVSMIVGLTMFYKAMITVDELISFTIAIGSFVALFYKPETPKNNEPNGNI